ncbi:MAG: hypothetical protein AAB975_01310, partial [Patescibacteria group bacterium]
MKFQYFISRRKSYVLCAVTMLALIVVAEFAMIIHARFTQPVQKKLSFPDYADAVVVTCASSDYRPGCYDKEIPKFMDVLSMEDVFKVTALVQQKDSGYWYCHVLGHNLSSR